MNYLQRRSEAEVSSLHLQTWPCSAVVFHLFSLKVHFSLFLEFRLKLAQNGLPLSGATLVVFGFCQARVYRRRHKRVKPIVASA